MSKKLFFAFSFLAIVLNCASLNAVDAPESKDLDDYIIFFAISLNNSLSSEDPRKAQLEEIVKLFATGEEIPQDKMKDIINFLIEISAPDIAVPNSEIPSYQYTPNTNYNWKSFIYFVFLESIYYYNNYGFTPHEQCVRMLMAFFFFSMTQVGGYRGLLGRMGHGALLFELFYEAINAR